MLSDCFESAKLREFCSTFNLTQLISQPTRVTAHSSTLLDVILTTNNDLVSKSDVICSDISDHFPVVITFKGKWQYIFFFSFERTFESIYINFFYCFFNGNIFFYFLIWKNFWIYILLTYFTVFSCLSYFYKYFDRKEWNVRHLQFL
jgi:hypothetical protein